MKVAKLVRKADRTELRLWKRFRIGSAGGDRNELCVSKKTSIGTKFGGIPARLPPKLENDLAGLRIFFERCEPRETGAPRGFFLITKNKTFRIWNATTATMG